MRESHHKGTAYCEGIASFTEKIYFLTRIIFKKSCSVQLHKGENLLESKAAMQSCF